jgi:hypothetical protein
MLSRATAKIAGRLGSSEKSHFVYVEHKSVVLEVAIKNSNRGARACQGSPYCPA